MRKLILLGVILVLASCATVEGIGHDISAGAQKVNNAL